MVLDSVPVPTFISLGHMQGTEVAGSYPKSTSKGSRFCTSLLTLLVVCLSGVGGVFWYCFVISYFCSLFFLLLRQNKETI